MTVLLANFRNQIIRKTRQIRFGFPPQLLSGALIGHRNATRFGIDKKDHLDQLKVALFAPQRNAGLLAAPRDYNGVVVFDRTHNVAGLKWEVKRK
jgi:hypothetical protein